MWNGTAAILNPNTPGQPGQEKRGLLHQRRTNGGDRGDAGNAMLNDQRTAPPKTRWRRRIQRLPAQFAPLRSP
jgi:hypothetical protein